MLATAKPAPLIIDPVQSHVEVIVKATVDSFTGTLAGYKADINVDGGRVTTATLTFEFADVKTGKAGRDEAMHAWQDTPHHPHVVFTLRSLTIEADQPTAHGDLMLHDVVRSIVFPVIITTDQTLYAIDGEVPLDTRDFGLPIIRKFGLLKVDPLVKVRFHLQGSVGVSVPKPSVTAP